MLEAQGVPGQRVIDYFVMASDVTIRECAGSRSIPTLSDNELFARRRSELCEALTKHQGIIPSIALYSDHEKERASTTSIVKHILYTELSKPFVVANIIFDLLSHIYLMLQYYAGATVAQSEAEYREDYLAGVNFLGVYFLARKLSEVASMIKLSPRSLRSYFFNSAWNILDILAISMTLATGALVTEFGDDKNSSTNGSVFAFTMGLLWIKFIGYLKSLNVRFATFILAIVQIVRDVFWFLVLLVIFALATINMLHILFYHSENCDKVGNDDASAFCDPDLGVKFRAIYSVMLGGNLNLDTYDEWSSAIVFYTFTFLGLIIMLNVLIAIVCYSYDTSRERAAKLFGRARLEFAAERISLEISLQRAGKQQHTNFRSKLGNCVLRFLVWFAIDVGLFINIFFIITLIVPDNFSGIENVPGVLLSVVIAVIGTTCQFVILGSVIEKHFERSVLFSTARNSPFLVCLSNLVTFPTKILGNIILGTSEISLASENTDGSGKDKCSERADHIIRETGTIVAESEARINSLVKALETQIMSCDMRKKL